METTKIISENLGRADTTVEVAELEVGNVWVHIKDGDAILFDSLTNLIGFLAGNNVPRKYCSEDDLMDLYEENTSWGGIPLTVVN